MDEYNRIPVAEKKTVTIRYTVALTTLICHYSRQNTKPKEGLLFLASIVASTGGIGDCFRTQLAA